MMPNLKPAYLIHGDDHGRIAERRANLRALAERESGANGIELFEGDAAEPEVVAGALAAMTFGTGWRFIIVDGVERWKDAELEPLAAALATVAPETTITFFAREEGRYKVPKKLHEAVKAAGGDISAEQAVKPWELPQWVCARATELGLRVDQSTAQLLVARVGERQQRLLRELEKLALLLGEGEVVTEEMVDLVTASSSERKVWSLADSLVDGDLPATLRRALELSAQGERPAGLVYALSGRLRKAGIDPERLKTALTRIADLELATRGGRVRGGLSSEQTEFTRSLIAIAK